MDPVTARARTWLYVPADRQDRFAKAAASGADRVILDLEDAVAPEAKADACRGLLSATLPGGVPVYVRINGAGTEWFDQDLAVASLLRISGILLPKADGAADVARAASALPASHRVVPIVETAAGVWNVLDVAGAARVERVVFGVVDFELDTGMRDEGEVLAPVRSRIVLASRVAGVARPVDSVCLLIDDEGALERDAARGRRFGFGGKLCVHPRQVGVVNRAFGPGASEVEWARRLLEAQAARPNDAAFSFRGTMVDRPIVERARQIVALADDVG